RAFASSASFPAAPSSPGTAASFALSSPFAGTSARSPGWPARTIGRLPTGGAALPGTMPARRIDKNHETVQPTAMIREFFAYYRPWKALFLLDFGCAVLSGMLELAFPLAARSFVDDLLPTQQWSMILLA